MDCLQIKLPGTSTDTSLRKLGDQLFFLKGFAIGKVIRFAYHANAATKISLDKGSTFHSSLGAANNDTGGSTVSSPSAVDPTYVNTYIRIKNANEILRINNFKNMVVYGVENQGGTEPLFYDPTALAAVTTGITTQINQMSRAARAIYAGFSITGNIRDLSRMAALTNSAYLNLSNTAFSLSELNNLSNITGAITLTSRIDSGSVRITGILESFINSAPKSNSIAVSSLPSITGNTKNIALASRISNVSFNISACPGVVCDLSFATSAPAKLASFIANLTLFEGNLSSIKDCVNLVDLRLSSDLSTTQSTMVGDIIALQNLNKLRVFRHGNTKNAFTGDLGRLPASITGFNDMYTLSIYTYLIRKDWTLNTFDNFEYSGHLASSQLDNLIIDLAEANWAGVYKLLTLAGQRTAASDAAMAKLVGKGVTVTIYNW